MLKEIFSYNISGCYTLDGIQELHHFNEDVDAVDNVEAMEAVVGHLVFKNLGHKFHLSHIHYEVNNRVYRKKSSTTWGDLEDRVPDNILGKWMDMVEEDSGNWPNWSDPVPQWVLDIL